jgi:hypothetical protein
MGIGHDLGAGLTVMWEGAGRMVIEAGVVAGYVIAWVVRKTQ